MSLCGSGGGGGVENCVVRRVQEEGATLPCQPTLNFIGDNVTAEEDADNNRINVTIEGGTSGHIIQDEGISLTQRTNLNFVGSSVVGTDDSGNDQTDVTVGVAVQDEGSDMTVRDRLNFIGSIVHCVDDVAENRTNIHITPFGLDLFTKGGIIGGPVQAGLSGTGANIFSQPSTAALFPICDDCALFPPLVNTSASQAQGKASSIWYQNVAFGGTQRGVGDGPTVILPGSAAGVFVNRVAPFYLARAEFVQLIGETLAGPGANVSAWAAEIRGNSFQPMGVVYIGSDGVISSGTTRYTAPGQGSNTAADLALTTAEDTTMIPMPAGTLRRLMLISGATSVADTVVVTTHKNQIATTSVITVAAGTVAGAFLDNTNTVTFADGDTLAWQVVNNGSGAYTVDAIVCEFNPTNSGTTGILIWPQRGRTFTASATRYVAPFSNMALLTTEAEARMPITRAATLRNLRCYLTTAPANTATVTMLKNGSPTTMTFTITSGGGTGVKGDLTHTFTVERGDTITLQVDTGAGAQPAITGWSLEEAADTDEV